jgi:hypothetical protein
VIRNLILFSGLVVVFAIMLHEHCFSSERESFLSLIVSASSLGTGAVEGSQGSKVHFYYNWPECQDEMKSDRCRSRYYVIPGDIVLIQGKKGSWLLATYVSAKGQQMDGFLPAKSIKHREPASVQALFQDWIGHWIGSGNEIDIEKGADGFSVAVQGLAYWAKGQPNEHVGSLSGTGTPKNQQFILNDGICEAALTLVPPYLHGVDNGKCGGMNVRFEGVYVKADDRNPTNR